MAELGLPGILQSRVGLRGGVARASGGPAAAAGPGIAPCVRGAGTARDARGPHAGWRILGCLLALQFAGLAQAQVLASRIWPAPDYTRLTLESKEEIQYTVFSIKNPERLVLDLEVPDITPALAELGTKVSGEDPYIQGLRVARNRPGVVRLVLDLKADVKPQVFTLKPVGEYGYRLVLDIFPLVPVDPLAALIEETKAKLAAAAPAPVPAPTPVPAPLPGKPSPPVIRLATVVIDPGHGGEDPGARGRRGTREKDVTLMIAKRLKALINEEANMRAILTRDADYFLKLESRVDKAQKVKADLFVSIHADAFVRSTARGSSVFALSEKRATSEAANWLAKKENDADLIGGVNLQGKDDHVKRTILDLSQTATIDYSLRVGNAVLQKIGGINTLHKGHVEQASFHVLKSPSIPSILIETAFISNPDEEKRLNDQGYQDKLARAILDGIRDYFAKHPPRGGSPLALN